MTSLLTHLAQVRFGKIDQIDVHVFIGNRNPKGWGAIQYLIHALRHPFLATTANAQTPTESWSTHHYFRNILNSTWYPFSRIEAPEDHFFPMWFQAQRVAFWVSLQYRWIHRVIQLIKSVQRISPSWLDPMWVNLLFYGHPIFLKRFGSTQGVLHVTTTHFTTEGTQTIEQQFYTADEGQRVPSFPLAIIGRIIAGELPHPIDGATRFIDVLPPHEFLEQLALEGISYRTSP